MPKRQPKKLLHVSASSIFSEKYPAHRKQPLLPRRGARLSHNVQIQSILADENCVASSHVFHIRPLRFADIATK